MSGTRDTTTRILPVQLTLNLENIQVPRSDLRELWTADDIYATAVREGATGILPFVEDNRVEWKSAAYSPRELGDYFSMWANTQPHGGVIVIGREKDGMITGCLSRGADRISEIERSGFEYCPDAQFESRRIPVVRSDGADDILIVVRVLYRSDKLVETTKGEAFVRIGSAKHRLSADERRELRIGKGEIAYELEAVSLKFPQEFDDLLITDFCREYHQKRGLQTSHTHEQILCLNHLGSIKEGKFIPNLACALLFALDPRAVIPGARVRFMRFEGTEEKTGQLYNVVRDVYVDGPIPRLILEADAVVSTQIRNFTRLGKDGKFYTRPEYPSSVWLEAIVNACVHRSYNLKNMNIFVKMFDDKLVVESPGTFPPPVTPANIYDTHNPRNPHLMNALFYLDFVKCAHEGTRRMRDDMRGAELPEPEFVQKQVGAYQVHVTLRNNIEARKEFVDAGALKILGESVYETLNQREKQVINFVAEKGAINVTDTNRLLHIDWQTAKKTLESLVKRQILLRRSQSGLERDPKARYVLRKRPNEKY